MLITLRFVSGKFSPDLFKHANLFFRIQTLSTVKTNFCLYFYNSGIFAALKKFLNLFVNDIISTNGTSIKRCHDFFFLVL